MGSLDGCNMVFITAGMGGGTGTGAAPVIARAARERGILTVGVVTKPFQFEGVHRMRLAESGMQDLTQTVDTLIIIPNQNLFRIANEKTTFADAFKMADDVLEAGVRGVTDLMVLPGLINLDFNDIRTVMTEMGKAMMGTGEADGEGRATQAAEAAIANPLLDDVSMRGARGVLINITGGLDLTLFEVDEAANKIREQVDPEANIIFGSTFDQTLEGKMRASIVATGIDAEAEGESRPGPSLSLVSNPKPQSAQAPATGMPSRTTMSPPMTAPAPTARTAAVPNMTAPAMTAQPHLHGSAALADQVEPLDLVEPATKAEGSAKESSTRFKDAAELKAEQQAEAAERFIAEIEAREDAFIAPRPLVAERPVEIPTRSRPEPFREVLSQQRSKQAEPAPATPEPRRSPGLIKRMTGLFHPSQQPEQAPEHSPAQTAPPSAPQRQAAPRAESRVHHQMPERTMPHPQAANPGQAPAAAQQTYLNLEEGRREPRMSDNQILDIPAFLRRQPN